MYAFKTLAKQYVRFIITAIGVALCLMLMLFLLAIYYGVSDASVRYVRESDADIWILQRHAANLLRGTSLLSNRHGEMIKQVDGVKSIAPILFFTATVKVPDNTASIGWRLCKTDKTFSQNKHRSFFFFWISALWPQ